MYINTLLIKKCFILFCLIVFQSKSFGQDFQWVYSIEGITPHTSQIDDVTKDANDNIYITGISNGKADFSEGSATLVRDTPPGLWSRFIIKLNKNKNVLWTKFFTDSEYSSFVYSGISVDQNQNLLITGTVYNSTQPFIDLDPNPGEQQTILNPTLSQQGFIIKLDSNGNYINSRNFEKLKIDNLKFDSNQNIIVVGTKLIEIFEDPRYFVTTVFKLDSNLNIIWTKEFDCDSCGIHEVVVDNQDNLILTGNYRNYLSFNGALFQNQYQNLETTFFCKLNSDSTDVWLLEQGPFSNGISNNSGNNILQIDENNIIYFTKNYVESSSFIFKNKIVTDLPYAFQNGIGSIFFIMDSNGNHLSHFTFSGLSDNTIMKFDINTFKEYIVGLHTTGKLLLQNSDNNEITTIESDSEYILLKISPSKELINFKELNHSIKTLDCDSENNILIGGNFLVDTDFDPHAINEYLVPISSPTNWDLFLLKLTNCDLFPPTGDDLIFCSGDNPAVRDLEANEYNVSWYSSLTATIPLDGSIALQNAQTYFAEKKKEEHCPQVIGRLPVLVTINPTPLPPTLNAIQPCFNTNLRLQDLSIDGENVDFYINSTTYLKLSKSTLIDPDVVYYMTQTVQGCKSDRVPLSIQEQSFVTLNDHTINLCDTDKNNSEKINISNYISSILTGNANDFTISYHNTQADAISNENPIVDYQNYQAINQTIYIRFVYTIYACFETANLTIAISSPPEITEIIVRDLTSNNNSITVLPNNPKHLYSIDGINYQNNNEFQNVLAGEYAVYVKDKLGVCGKANDKVYVLKYPKFFTPNGDGYNDFWKIKYAEFQFSVDVEIYDRFGKLLTSFNKNSPGWDGKLNGKELPSTDYWFIVTRVSDKKTIHKGHFSLKR